MKSRLDDSLGLAVISPGPELCAASAAQHNGLTERTGLEVLEVVAAEARAVAHHQARLYAAAWEAALRNPAADDPLARMEYPDDAAVYEVGYRLRMGRAATGDMLSVAFELFVRVPAVGEALRRAEIDLARAKVFAVGVHELGEEHARKVVAALLPKSHNLSIPRLKAAIVRHALALDPAYGDRVRDEALRRSNVRAVLKHDGSADVVLSNIAPDRAAGVTGRLDHLATAMQAEGDPRGVGELRALISVCSQDGTWVGLSEAQILDYLRDTRPHPDDPDYPEPPPPSPPPPSPPGAGPDDLGDAAAGDDHADHAGHAGHGEPADPDDLGDAAAGDDYAETADPDEHVGAAEECSRPAPLADDGRATEAAPGPAANAGPAAGSVGPGAPSDRSPTPFGPAIGVDVKLSLATLLGLDQHPGEIVGLGPVTATYACELARTYAAGRWRWAVCGDDGYLLEVGSTRVRPQGWAGRDARSAAVVELRVPKAILDALFTGPPPGVEPHLWSAWTPVLADIAAGCAAARAAPPPNPRRRRPDAALRLKVVTAIRYCVGPFCHVPSRRAQLDHGYAYARGGPTLFHNLGPLCGGQHRQKTDGHAEMLRIGLWTFRWTTRLGAVYEVVVPPLLDDLPDPDPTPAECTDDPAPRRRHTVEDDPATVAASWIPRQRPGRDWPAFYAAEIHAERAAHEAARRAWTARRANPAADDIPPF